VQNHGSYHHQYHVVHHHHHHVGDQLHSSQHHELKVGYLYDDFVQLYRAIDLNLLEIRVMVLMHPLQALLRSVHARHAQLQRPASIHNACQKHPRAEPFPLQNGITDSRYEFKLVTAIADRSR